MENTAWHLMLVISLLVLANFLSAPVALAKESKKAPTVSLKYEMLVTGKSPYSLKDRKNLSLHCGGGKGVLITPKWAMTASHCITSRKQQAGQVNVKFTGTHGKPVQIKVDKVVRHDSKDVALLRLVRPVKKEERMPVLLLRETLVGSIKVKKVTGSMVWRGIPAVGKQGNLIVPKKADRRGKAGSSGSPWLLYSPKVGDVLVGITHGGGRAPQVAPLSRWIQDIVQKHGPGRLVWATKKQALGK